MPIAKTGLRRIPDACVRVIQKCLAKFGGVKNLTMKKIGINDDTKTWSLQAGADRRDSLGRQQPQTHDAFVTDQSRFGEAACQGRARVRKYRRRWKYEAGRLRAGRYV